MKRIEKRRMLATLVNLGNHHAAVARDIGSGLSDAVADESELTPIYSRLGWIWSRTFVEMAEVMTGVPTLVGGMDEWGAMIKEGMGSEWTNQEKTAFDFFLSEYQRAVDASGGEAPVGFPSMDDSNETFTVVFDDRDEDDEEE